MKLRRTAYVILSVFLSIQSAFFVSAGNQASGVWPKLFLALAAFSLLLAVVAMSLFANERPVPAQGGRESRIRHQAWVGGTALFILLRLLLSIAGLFPSSGADPRVHAVWAVVSLICAYLLTRVAKMAA